MHISSHRSECNPSPPQQKAKACLNQEEQDYIQQGSPLFSVNVICAHSGRADVATASFLLHIRNAVHNCGRLAAHI